MKIRQGWPQDLGLYIQQGDEPASEDEYFGIIFDPARTEVLVQILNGERPPFGEQIPHQGWREGDAPRFGADENDIDDG